MNTSSTLPPTPGLSGAGGIRIGTGATLLIVYVGLCAVFAFLSPAFLTWNNVAAITQTLAIVGIVAIGQTLVLIGGGVDISVGSTAALAGVTISLFWTTDQFPMWFCALMGILSGSLVGLVNGLIITRLKIIPLITTLGMFSVIRGLAFVLSGGSTNQLIDAGFQLLGRGDIAGAIPYSLVIMLMLYAVFIFVLMATPFGRNLYAIGGSPDASRLAGINVQQHILIAYIICGTLAAFGGVVISAQLATSTPQAATGLEFTVIAAVILGGTSLAGGKGTLIGTLIGVIILRTLDNGLILTGVSSYYQDVARGLVLLLAVGIDQIRQKVRARQRGGF